jgi:hypothetical protein
MVSGEDDDSDDDDAWSRYDTATSLAHLPNVRPFLEPIGGSTSQASWGASAPVEGEEELGERGRSGAFSERSHLVWGPTGGVGGAAPASPSALGLDGGRGSGVGIRSRGTVDGHEDPRPASLGCAKDLGRPVSQGSEEHPASRRLDGRAVVGGVGWL